MVKNIRKEVFTKDNIRDFLFIVAGCLVQAVGMVVFMVPANLVSGGITGLAQVLNHLTGWPIGVMTLLGNIPIMLLGWRYLGRLRFVLRTAAAIVFFSVFTDVLYYLFPDPALTDDLFLNTIFGAVIMGFGFGLVYLGGGTSGGTDVIDRILNQRLGFSITYSYMVSDIISILLGAIIFGWKLGLYAVIVVYISGKAAELVSEGSDSFRQAFIISNHHAEITEKILREMDHGVTVLHGAGGYSGSDKEVLYCVINRSEVNTLKRLVAEADPNAFVIVGLAKEVLGEGFQKNKYYK